MARDQVEACRRQITRLGEAEQRVGSFFAFLASRRRRAQAYQDLGRALLASGRPDSPRIREALEAYASAGTLYQSIDASDEEAATYARRAQIAECFGLQEAEFLSRQATRLARRGAAMEAAAAMVRTSRTPGADEPRTRKRSRQPSPE
jgi:hypothetical protein